MSFRCEVNDPNGEYFCEKNAEHQVNRPLERWVACEEHAPKCDVPFVLRGTTPPMGMPEGRGPSALQINCGLIEGHTGGWHQVKIGSAVIKWPDPFA